MRIASLVCLVPVFLLACTTAEETGCPVDKPSDKSSCGSDAKVCEYEELDGSDVGCDDLAVTAFRCEGGVWVDYGAECHCPGNLPVDGSDCLGYHDTHDCGDYCGGNGPVAQCGSETDYLWEVSGTCP